MFRENQRGLMALTLLGSVSGLAVGPAFAQSDSVSYSVQVEDVVVTAQKREERLQDVPLSIAAFGGETLERLKIQSTADLGVITPALQMNRQINTVQPFIRGIGAQSSQPGEELKTAIYVDGVYQASMSAGLLGLNNVERVEVLRGPQGTLFGRNAVAGVVQIVTRNPSFTPSANVKLGYGRFDAIEAGLYATGKIASNVAADLAISYNKQNDGWGENILTGRDAFTSREFYARSKVLFDLGPNTEIVFSADISDGRTQEGSAVRKFPGTGTLVGGNAVFPGFYNLNTTMDPNFYPGGKEPGSSKEGWGASLTVRHDMSWADFVSITAFRALDTVVETEITGGPRPYSNSYYPVNSDTASQEFQLLSPEDAPFKWIGGLYYYQNLAAYRDARQTGVPQGGPRNFLARHTSQSARSYAAFGQVTIPLGSETNLLGGLRYTSDRRHVRGMTYTQATSSQFFDQSKSFNKLTYKASLDHKFAESVMGYVLYSRGFKGGLFNTFQPNAPAVLPEVMDDYEGGFKTQWFDNRLKANVGAFYSKIVNLQVNQVVQGNNRTTNAGSAETKGFEAEITAAPMRGLTITAAGAYVKAKYLSFQNALITSPNPAGGNFQVVGDATGKRLPGAPEWTGSVRAGYKVPTEAGSYSFDVVYSYNSGFYWSTDNRLKEPSYSLLNASVTWTDENDRIAVTVWGRNLLGAKYHSFGLTSSTGDVGSPAAPLTFGVTLSANFD